MSLCLACPFACLFFPPHHHEHPSLSLPLYPPSNNPICSALSTRPPREPGRSRGFPIPISPSPSPFLILSTPPLERSTLDARTWSNPLSFESRSNPIQSGPASPAQSCPVLSSQSPIRPSQSPPPTHSPKDRQDYLEQILPLCCCFLASPLAFAARRSPLARPAGPGTRRPLPHQTLQLSVYCILHSSSTALPLLSAGILSVDHRLPYSSLFTDLQPSLPGQSSSSPSPASPNQSLPSHSLAAAAFAPLPHR